MKKEEMTALIDHLIKESKWNEFFDYLSETGKTEAVLSILNTETDEVSACFLGKTSNLVDLITDLTTRLIDQKPVVGLYLITKILEKARKQMENNSSKQNINPLAIFNMMNNEDNIPN